jgi:hypothetical protein
MRPLLTLIILAFFTPLTHAGTLGCRSLHRKAVDQFGDVARALQPGQAYISKVAEHGWVKIDLGNGQSTWSHPDYVTQNLSTLRWLWGFQGAKIVTPNGK